MKRPPSPRSAAAELLKVHMRAEGFIYGEEFVFHTERKWRFDFALFLPIDEKAGVAVEIDGGNHMVRKTKDGRSVAVGRHTKPDDYRKLNEAAILGWHVLRFTPDMVKSGEAIATIKRMIG